MTRNYFKKGNEDYVNSETITGFNDIIDSFEFKKYNPKNSLFANVVKELKIETPRYCEMTFSYGGFCLYAFEYQNKEIDYFLDTPDQGLIKIANDKQK